MEAVAVSMQVKQTVRELQIIGVANSIIRYFLRKSEEDSRDWWSHFHGKERKKHFSPSSQVNHNLQKNHHLRNEYGKIQQKKKHNQLQKQDRQILSEPEKSLDR